MTNDPLSVRLPERIKLAEIDAKAKERGLSRAGFVIGAIETMLGFDPEFMRRIESYSKGLNVPTWQVIQSMVVDRFAREAAELEVFGPSPGKLLPEFQYANTPDGPRPLTAEELFDSLKGMHRHRLEQDRLVQLLERERYVDLHGKDREFMIRMRAGKTYAETEEGRQAREIDALADKLLREMDGTE